MTNGLRILGIRAAGHSPLLGLSVLLVLAADPALAATVVAPNAYLSTEGDNSNLGVLNSGARTFQYVFAASQFSGLVGDSLTALAFRLNGGGSGSLPGTALNFAQYDIQLSQSRNGPGSLDTIFANNIGSDVVTVRSGPLTIPAGNFPAGAVPNAFGVSIDFATPYRYTGGDLLVTLRESGHGLGSAFTPAVDSVNNASVATIAEGIGSSLGSSELVANGATSTAVVIRFTAVPVPAALGLFGSALLALGAWRGRGRTAPPVL